MLRVRIVNMKSALAALVLASLALVPPAKGQASSSAPRSVSKKQPELTTGPARTSPAPDFALESLNGETVHLSDFRGKVVLLSFWATWCAPCKILTPWFVDLQNQYGPQGLQTLGVTLDEDATKVEIGEFADKMRMTYPVLIGNEKVADTYGGVPALPETLFIGRDGKIVDKIIIGLKGKGEIEDSIKKALSAQTAATSGTATRAQE